MGCGGSSTFNEDGSVAVGKGETKIEWSSDKPVKVGFYYYSDKDAKCHLKEFPMDKECAEKVFTTDGVSSNGSMHWVNVVPGNRYAMKYTEGGNSAAFPGQKALEIPKQVHAFHTKDDAAKDKLVADLKKDVEKDKEHPYSAEGADDKIKADIDAIGGMKNCQEMSDDMAGFKKACVTAEDLQPWNTINANLALDTEYGYWDEKEGKLSRELGLAEKVKQKAEEEVAKKGPEMIHKGLSKAQEVFKKVIDGAVKGACKKAGPPPEELAGNLDARIDAMDGCVPGAPRAAERKLPEKKEGEGEEKKEEEKKEEEKKEGEEEDPVVAAAKAQYEADKGKLDGWKSDDNKDHTSSVESYLKEVAGSVSEIDPSADTNKAVIANTQGFQAPAYIYDIDGDDVKVTYAANNWQDESDGKIPKEVDGTVDGADGKIKAFTSLPKSDDAWLVRGQAVTFRKDRAFCAGFVKSVDGDIVNIEDQFKCAQQIKKEDVFTHMTQQQVATHGMALMPNYAPLKFWWHACEDPNVTVRKLKIWRLGAPDTAVTVDLQAVRQPAKPSKENKEPQGDVHVGYCAEVDCLIGAKYAYNFQIGEEYYVDWEKKVANENGFKAFTCNARVEYQ